MKLNLILFKVNDIPEGLNLYSDVFIAFSPRWRVRCCHLPNKLEQMMEAEDWLNVMETKLDLTDRRTPEDWLCKGMVRKFL